MTTNMFKKYTESLVREWNVGASKPAGSTVIDPLSGQVGVTLVASGGTTKTTTLPDGSTFTTAIGGVGVKANAATVAVDGSFIYAVAGVANGETVSPGTGTPKGTKVYRVAADGSLTLTVGSNVYFGVIDDGNIVGGIAPVQIGVGTP